LSVDIRGYIGVHTGVFGTRQKDVPPLMPLSDTAIRNAKLAASPFKLFDSGGLYLLVKPNGSRLWRFKYRAGGKEKLLALGIYPDVPLKLARERRDDARQLAASGIDPSEQRKAEKAAGIERGANSFEVIAREWHAKFSTTWVQDHASRIMLRLENDVFPWIGSRPIAEVKAQELLETINRVVARGAIESAHRVLQNCGQVFRYAIATGRAERNVAADLRGALPSVKETHHAAITEPENIGALLRAIYDYRGSRVTKCALQLAPLVFVRPGELRQAEWVEFELDAAEWNIPAARMKMRQSHLVPLSAQAVAILRELHALTGRDRYVFPGFRSRQRPMSNNAINAALRRMGFAKDEMTGHGFRAMARTILDEVLEVRPDYIEHQLAHSVRDPNGRAYNRTSHLAERRKMMQVWADYLDRLRTENTVVAFKRA
jgi:integrase